MASKERERQLARERYERQQLRRAAARARERRRQQVIGAVVALVAVVGGMAFLASRLGGDEPSTTANAPTSPSPSGVDVCEKPVPAPAKPLTFAKEPPLTVEKTTYEATLKTNCGEIVLSLDAAKAPKAVNSFKFLAEKGYFDGAPCHRLTTGSIYVLQCGDPTGTGTGGPGYSFADENLPKEGAKNYPAGTVAMANSGPGTNGSQFFLVYQDTQLPPNYTIFGRVKVGTDVIDKVRFGGVEEQKTDGPPVQKISITGVTVAEAS